MSYKFETDETLNTFRKPALFYEAEKVLTKLNKLNELPKYNTKGLTSIKLLDIIKKGYDQIKSTVVPKLTMLQRFEKRNPEIKRINDEIRKNNALIVESRRKNEENMKKLKEIRERNILRRKRKAKKAKREEEREIVTLKKFQIYYIGYAGEGERYSNGTNSSDYIQYNRFETIEEFNNEGYTKIAAYPIFVEESDDTKSLYNASTVIVRDLINGGEYTYWPNNRNFISERKFMMMRGESMSPHITDFSLSQLTKIMKIWITSNVAWNLLTEGKSPKIIIKRTTTGVEHEFDNVSENIKSLVVTNEAKYHYDGSLPKDIFELLYDSTNVILFDTHYDTPHLFYLGYKIMEIEESRSINDLNAVQRYSNEALIYESLNTIKLNSGNCMYEYAMKEFSREHNPMKTKGSWAIDNLKLCQIFNPYDIVTEDNLDDIMAKGVSVNQWMLFSAQYNINTYVFDMHNNTMKVEKYGKHNKVAIFYIANAHMYPITNKETIKSLTEKAKTGITHIHKIENKDSKITVREIISNDDIKYEDLLNIRRRTKNQVLIIVKLRDLDELYHNIYMKEKEKENKKKIYGSSSGKFPKMSGNKISEIKYKNILIQSNKDYDISKLVFNAINFDNPEKKYINQLLPKLISDFIINYKEINNIEDISYYNNTTRDILTTKVKAKQFNTNTKVPISSEVSISEILIGIDQRGSYPRVLVNNTDVYPVFTVFDEIEYITLDELKQIWKDEGDIPVGYYQVNTIDYTLFHPDFSNQCTRNLIKIAINENIPFILVSMIRASYCVPADSYKNLLQYFNIKLSYQDAKIANMRLTGMFGKTSTKKYDMVITETKDDIFYYYRDKTSKIVDFDGDNVKKVINMEETIPDGNSVPIYNQMMCEYYISLYYTMKKIGFENIYSCDTDCIAVTQDTHDKFCKEYQINMCNCIDVKNCTNISQHLYKTDKVKIHNYKSINLLDTQIDNYEFNYNSVIYNSEKWKTNPIMKKYAKDIRNPESFKNLIDLIINQIFLCQSLYISGPGGTGKTYLINELCRTLHNVNPKMQIEKIAFTNAAALLINGKTCHNFLGMTSERNEPTKNLCKLIKNLGVLIIDEVSMLTPEIITAMNHIKEHYNFPVIYLGDFAQCQPILHKQLLHEVDYENSYVFKYICDFKKIELVECLRADKTTFEICKKFENIVLPNELDNLIKYIEKFTTSDFIKSERDEYSRICSIIKKKNINKRIKYINNTLGVPRELQTIQLSTLGDIDRILCFHKYKRIQINTKINNEKKLQQEVKEVDDFGYIYENLPLIANTTVRDGNIITYANGQNYIVMNFDDDEITLMPTNGDEINVSGSELIISYDDLQYFDIGYCTTVHRAQGSTIRKKYIIYEWDKFDKYMKYTALSRTDNIKNIYICDTQSNLGGYCYQLL
jgi:hypothetical protein